MGRSPCCDKNGLKKGPWTQEEDLKLTEYIQLHGPGNWRTLPKNAGKCLHVMNTSLFFCVNESFRFVFANRETLLSIQDFNDVEKVVVFDGQTT